MLHTKKILAMLFIVMISACNTSSQPGDPPAPTISTTKPSTAVPTTLYAENEPSVEPISTSTPATESNQVLTICVREGVYPGYIYFNGTSDQTEVLQSIVPDPIELGNDYRYYPTILEKLPDLEDGNAFIQQVTLHPLDKVVDINGNITPLIAGVSVLPSGCFDKDCAVTYDDKTDIQMDQLVVNFTLLENLKWSDGEPLTAQDSVFAFQVIHDPAFNDLGCASCGLPEGTLPDVIEYTADYSAIDKRTVQWIGLPGFITPWYFLNFFSPMPVHLLEGMAPDRIDQFTATSSGKKMLGWGPFMIESWKAGEYMSVVRNPYYHQIQEGFPLLDSIEWKSIEDEMGRGLAGVLTGECDLASYGTTLREVLWGNGSSLYQGAQTEAGISMHAAPQGWDGISFNFSSTILRDQQVRLAIFYGTDRISIAKSIVGSDFLVAQSYVPNQHYLYSEVLNKNLYDPDRARDLLTAAGWMDQDGDGIVEKDGLPFIIDLLVQRGISRAPGVPIFQKNMGELGIKVNVQFFDPELEISDENLSAVQGYDLYWGIWASTTWWRGGASPNCAAFMTSSIPTSSDQIGQWDYQNIMGYSNLDFDNACLAGLDNLDPEKAAQAHILAQQLWSQDLSVVPLYFWPNITLARREVTGLQLDATGAITNFETLDIQPSP